MLFPMRLQWSRHPAGRWRPDRMSRHRCPAEAPVMGDDDLSQFDMKRCFGCAVCATGCPEEAIKMRGKTEAVAPPKDNKALMEAMITAFSSKD